MNKPTLFEMGKNGKMRFIVPKLPNWFYITNLMFGKTKRITKMPKKKLSKRCLEMEN